MKLFQREACPSCTKIREWLGRHNMSYEIVNVAKLGNQRQPLIDMGLPVAVPMLQDGEETIAGSEKIIAYLEEKYGSNDFGDPIYGLTKNLGKMDFTETRAKVEAALKEVGFGVLTEIDVKATLKKKIDVDFKPYLILGACNPKLAHQALLTEPGIGLLLPCNVVISQNNNGDIIVSAIDPMKMMMPIERDEMKPFAMEVRKLLVKAVSSL